MRTRLRTLAATTLATLFMLAPYAVGAAPFDKPLVPCNGADCSICDLATLAQNILNAAIYMAVFLAAGLFAWAGGLYLTSAGNPTQAGKAKGVFVNVALGLIFILGSWLLVDIIMKTLTPGGGKFGPWNQIC
jgi:hypothetical protein